MSRKLYLGRDNKLEFVKNDRDVVATLDGAGSVAIGRDTSSPMNVSGFMRLVPKTDATRGAAGTAGRVIFNTDDGNLNIDNGTNWILPDGTVT